MPLLAVIEQAPRFSVGETVRVGEKGADLEVLQVHVAYDLGVAGRVVAKGVNERDLWPVAERCKSALGYQGEILWETQCTLNERHAGPHQYASDPRTRSSEGGEIVNS